MKKILLINASNRKKTTFNLLSSIEDILKNHNFQTEIISLKDYKIDYCKGCECCITKDKCFIDDDCSLIMNKIKSCDGLIIGTPVYMNNMAGILKSFLDRTCKWFHRSEVAGKPTLLLVDTQGSGIKNTLKSIEEAMVQWGVSLCSTVSRTGRTSNNPIEEKEISKFINLINSNGIGYSPSFKEINTYNVQRVLATNVFPLDKDYWDKNTWLKSPYYPDAKVNFIKKAYGNFLYKSLSKVIKPHDN